MHIMQLKANIVTLQLKLIKIKICFRPTSSDLDPISAEKAEYYSILNSLNTFSICFVVFFHLPTQ